jgi:hypothetical protein
MIRSRRTRASLTRRLCTALAALGLLFAATVASVTHSIAMPMMPAMPSAAAETMHPDMAMPAAAPHDHGCDHAGTTDDAPAAPSAPCDTGCLLCKSCSLASAVMPAQPALAAAAPYRDYRVALLPMPSGIAPTPPNEPPRP